MRACIAVAVGFSWGGEVLAQPRDPAEEAFEKGQLLMEAKLHERACAAFELSYRLDPQFGTQFNLAGCYVNIQKVATAVRLYRELSRTDSNVERRSKAAELAAELAPHVPTVRVRVPLDHQSTALRVFVGQTEVTSLLDTYIPFDADHYTIEARLPGHRPFRREIDLQLNSVLSIDVELERELAPTPKRTTSELAGGILIAGGVGLLAFGFFGSWRWYVNDREAGAMPTSGAANEERARIWAGVSALSFLFGTGLVVTGGVIPTPSRSQEKVRVAPAVGAGAASLTVSGAF